MLKAPDYELAGILLGRIILVYGRHGVSVGDLPQNVERLLLKRYWVR
jgi:hypothetical protein